MAHLIAIAATIALLALPAAGDSDVSAQPPLTPQVQNGVTFLTGGVGDREQAALLELDDEYNVRIALTDADGAYLTRVHVTIDDAQARRVLETTTRGPVVLAKLDPGRYLLRARVEGRTTEQRVIDVPRGDDRVRLYVALPDTDRAAQEG